jgi:glycosyltransferase involved in cell wall biosynthesis
MKASVIICTHNRASLLLDLLKSFKDQSVPPDRYELIVVDNASSDTTRDIVNEVSVEMKNLKYLHEPELGLSRARNTGIKNAQGEIIVFVDDDICPEANWLEVLITSFESYSPRPLCVGGRILPKWQAQKPDWLPDNSKLRPLSLLDWGDHPIWLSTPSLGGGNLAIRKSALSHIGGFDKKLGRVGKKLMSMEEILFLFLVLQEYGKQSLLYQPKAVVYHCIPQDKIVDRRYILRRSYGDGVSKAIMKIIISRMNFCGNRNLTWLQLARYRKMGALAESAMRLVYGCVSGIQALACLDQKELTECLMNFSFGMGGMIELMKHLWSISGTKQ